MKSPVIPINAGKQLGHAQGGQQPIAGATIQLWQVNTTVDGGLGTAMLTGTVTTSDGSGNIANSNANAGNLFNTLPTGYFLITGMYTCPVGDALVYITASGGNPGLGSGTSNPQSKMITALGSCDNLKANVQSINISEQTTVGTVASLYAFMSAYNAIGASPAHRADLAASFALINEYVDFQTGTAPGPALPAGYSASTGDVNLLANVLAACVNSQGGTYDDGSPCGTLFYYASASSNPSTDVTAAALYIRKYGDPSGNIAGLPAPQAPFEPADTTAPPDWTLPIFELPSPPTFSLSPGTYSGVQQVHILEADAAANVYYSFGASPPSVNGLYSNGPITVSTSETINAIAVAAQGRATSAIASAAYTITGVPTNIPTVSVYGAFALPVGSTTPITITARGSVNGSVVTFATSGGIGGSFSPLTCTISSNYCSVTYTPTGTAPVGTYANALSASYSAVGNYTSTTALAPLFVVSADAITPLAFENDIDSSLIQASDGYFYGVDPSDQIFRMDSSGNLTPVYTFTDSTVGAGAVGSLIQGTDGAFYGVTAYGGTANSGTVFRVDASGNFTQLYSFTGTLDGGLPKAGLVQGTDGSFYGVTEKGGANSFGTVFKVDAGGNFTLLHPFAAGSDGSVPGASLLQGADGNFYGTTYDGGTYDLGTIFKMATSGDVTTLYSFTGGADGSHPNGGLVQGPDGSLYGVTLQGGISGGGVVYKIDTSANLVPLYGFSGFECDQPVGTLVQGSDGAFYGAGSEGGNNGGCLFKTDASGNFTVLSEFTAASGSRPFSGLLEGADGGFYGTTSYGGSIFRLTPSPALSGPVILNVPASVTHGAGFTLTYTVANATSQTLQQCFATNNGGDASGWTGTKTAATTVKDATLTAPSTTGTYTYTLTCGGIESGFATLNVN